MKKAFINRTPLRFVGGTFMLLVGMLAKSTPLVILGLFDLGISFAFFLKPEIEDNKILKVIVGLIYGAILVWCISWLSSMLP
jgi:hypothetical protein